MKFKMAADSEMEKNGTNGFLAQNSIIFQKNTTFPFIGKKITNPNFATIQHIDLLLLAYLKTGLKYGRVDIFRR